MQGDMPLVPGSGLYWRSVLCSKRGMQQTRKMQRMTTRVATPPLTVTITTVTMTTTSTQTTWRIHPLVQAVIPLRPGVEEPLTEQ